MKSKVIVLALTLLTTNFAYSQFSLDSGLAIPIGKYTSADQGEAGIGWTIRPAWDIFFTENIGIATGFIIGKNRLSNKAKFYDRSSWKFAAVELGLVIRLSEVLRIKGMLLKGVYRTPIYTSEEIIVEDLPENTTFSSYQFSSYSHSTANIGFDLRIEYTFRKFYTSSNFMFYKSDFTFLEDFDTSYNRSVSIQNLGLSIGYRFGSRKQNKERI